MSDTWIGYRAFDDDARFVANCGQFPVYIFSKGYRWMIVKNGDTCLKAAIRCMGFKTPWEGDPILVPCHELIIANDAEKIDALTTKWVHEPAQKELKALEVRPEYVYPNPDDDCPANMKDLRLFTK